MIQMLNVEIDRLNINISGISTRMAHNLANNLGKDLLEELAKRQTTIPRNLPLEIDKIDLGLVNYEGRSSYSNLNNMIVSNLADAIHNRLNNKIMNRGTGLDG